jgi:Zn-dependent protease
MANVVTAAIFALPIRMGIVSWHSPFAFRGLQDQGLDSILADLLGFVIFFNIILAVFNLIPLFPLDGSKVAAGFLSPGLASTLARWDAAGPAILIGIIMVDWATDLNLLWGVLRPLVDMVGFIVLGHAL